MDITMCKADGCILALKCKRYTAKESEMQSYFTDAPYRIVNGETKCEMFWGETQDSIMNQLNEIVNGKDNERRTGETGTQRIKETE